MPRKITEKQRQLAIRALAEGKTTREAGKAAGISKDAANELQPEADQLKKEIGGDTKEWLQGVCSDIRKSIDIAAKALMKPGKIDSQSGAAISVTLGTLVDKLQLLTGGATENIHVTAGNRDDAIRRIRGQADPSKRVLIMSQPEPISQPKQPENKETNTNINKNEEIK